MIFGDFEIRAFVEHRFRLDGGMMFGVVPKTFWNRMIPSDENNLIPFVNNIFVLSAHGKNIIFDVGLGDTLSDREKKVYSPESECLLTQGLSSLGLSVHDIDYVFLSHMHTDHAGGVVVWEDNEYRPRFPKATYLMNRKEWEAALHPDERTSSVYIPARYNAIKDAGKLEFYDGDQELFAGIRAVFTGGHSEGHSALEMESGGQRVWFYADMFPTVHHLRVPYVPATDVYPNQTMAVKRQLLPKLVDSDVILAFDHDVNVQFGKVVQVERKVLVQRVDA
jgi:glyoxylase-like metal-dependent hydrolase (beta-lactamase superfamily II)